MLRILLSLMLLIGLAGPLQAAGVPDFSAVAGDEAEEFLPVEQAFRLKSEPEGGNALRLEWKIAPGYGLYKDRLAIGVIRPAGVALAALVFRSPSVIKQDPSFGRVAVFHDELKATLALDKVPAAAAGKPVEVWVRYQGCADAGLCYPPQTVKLTLPAPVAAAGRATPAPTPAPAGAASAAITPPAPVGAASAAITPTPEQAVARRTAPPPASRPRHPPGRAASRTPAASPASSSRPACR